MQVSFVIPLYNCLAATQAMVASLQATLPAGLAYEIILVDDGSTDGTRAWLTTLGEPFRIILNERNLGYATANNRGAAVARGEFLALLNNDLVLTPHWLGPLLNVFQQLGPRAGLVGNVQREIRTGAIDHTGIFINHKGKPEHDRTLPWWSWLSGNSWRRMTAVTGACMMIGRAQWNELGGFDESYVNGGEDVDLCLRAAASGRVNAVALRSVVFHHVSLSAGRKTRDEENSWKFTRRWHDTLVRLGARPWCVSYLELLRATTPAEVNGRIARDAVLYVNHLRKSPPPLALAGTQAAIGKELARWEKMFQRATQPTLPLPNASALPK
jgi:GT2 family glycosyltransferase